jgi:DNA-directed RNA polymerase specialized sigma24 family protein
VKSRLARARLNLRGTLRPKGAESS